MDDGKTTASRQVEPVTATIIGTGDASRLMSGTEAVTPDPHQPNVIVSVIQPAFAIFVRAINLFLVSLSGFVTGGLTPAGNKMLGAPDFYHLVLIGAGFAVAPVGIGLIKDLITVFGRLEQKYPLATGSI